MIKTLSPYSNTAKTAEIMSRYRPIAPKPEGPASSLDESSSMSQKIRESPYLRTLWPQMQARPTRTRKRGRASVSLPIIKRRRTHLLGLSSPSHVISPAKHLSLQGFVHGIPQLSAPSLVGVNSGLENSVTVSSDPVTLPLLHSPTTVTVIANQAAVPELNCLEPNRDKLIDLNTVAEAEFPEEKDLLQQLQVPSHQQRL
ncbi:VON WILLEBRAND FACTOR A DOMAIN PROTEIN [Salix koriyanagi]|uniref:VON WILLEBRAND FACTOR A DOMAIN PROTEIN n=1 Tax=Salix koriyanagi TaxID=2511006 RepID=A0A9Q0TDP0_9ROSI|nr:VON WILLEBRAND FACTOR A DOMAIN PROTEIN [Salix koriyanagi]